MGIALALIAALAVAHGTSTVATPAPSPAPAAPPGPAAPALVVPSGPPIALFEFHSGFWLNLHHVLYAQTQPRQIRLEPEAEKARHAWSESVGYYRDALSKRDLLMDDFMRSVKDRLGDLEDAPTLRDSGLQKELVEALERAAPVYRAQWWAEHDKKNRAWVESVAPLVRDMGPGIASRLAALLEAKWPNAPVRVDVTYVSNWAGAYTTLQPTRITIGGGEEGNQGDTALEVLFHESTHALMQPLLGGIARASKAAGKPAPRDLWHTILFYTVGDVVRAALGAHGSDGYVPMADRGLWTGSWKPLHEAIEKGWVGHLQGKDSFDEGIRTTLAALP